MPTYAYITQAHEIRDILTACAPSFHDTAIAGESQIASLSAKFSKAARVLVVREQDTVLGFCAYYANDLTNLTAYISMIVITAEAQGRGIGSQLLSRVIEDSRRRGMTTLRLEVALDNERALGFYAKHGFSFEHGTGDHLYLIRAL
ncbi:MAG: GNAT family N-acetyltransferase [Acidobacteriota bacterium]|nr:GNAT family N-acetyltransferase [Acidobacteriota bacterium]